MLLIAAGLYLFLILVTYHRSDPGWSHSATEAVTRNAGGAFGAWLSDLLLYLFGLSAYWWVALCLYLVVWGWRRMDGFRLGAAISGEDQQEVQPGADQEQPLCFAQQARQLRGQRRAAFACYGQVCSITPAA